LQRAALYWDGFDALLADDRQAQRDMLMRMLAGQHAIAFLAGNTIWEPVDVPAELSFIRIEFPRPTYAERAQLWAQSLNGDAIATDGVNVRELADKFRLSAGQIRDAAATARGLARWRDPEHTQVSMADLTTACRLQSNRKLGVLAHKITPGYSWGDI